MAMLGEWKNDSYTMFEKRNDSRMRNKNVQTRTIQLKRLFVKNNKILTPNYPKILPCPIQLKWPTMWKAFFFVIIICFHLKEFIFLISHRGVRNCISNEQCEFNVLFHFFFVNCVWPSKQSKSYVFNWIALF